MADQVNMDGLPIFETEVLIIGAGPAGAGLAAFLGNYGITGLVVNRARSTSNTPRAHYKNLGAMECLRDIGLEYDVLKVGNLEKEVGVNYRWGTTMNGREWLRSFSFGNHPHKQGQYFEASPCDYVDIPQTLVEPILIRYATQNGFQARFDTNFISFEDDLTTNTVTTLLQDRITGQYWKVKSKFLAGADGARSKVAEQLEIPFVKTPGGGLALNVLFDADLSKAVDGRVGLLHVCYREEQERPDWGVLGICRLIQPWKEWAMVMMAAPHVEEIKATEEEIVARTKELLGGDVPDFKLKNISRWKINEQYAESQLSKGNVFCLGDAIHRHPPHAGFGSNTSIQDSYNLAWKIAHVLRHGAPKALLHSYNVERQPVAKQIVSRAFDASQLDLKFASALGMLEETVEARTASVAELRANTPEAAERRKKVQKMQGEMDIMMSCLGAEMNQVYEGAAAAVYADTETQGRPPFEGEFDYHYTEHTYPGFRLPHAWLNTGDRKGEMISTQDLAGKGRFSLFTGIGGKEVWSQAIQKTKEQFPTVEIACFSIGIGQDYEDMYWMWENKREVKEDGAILVRPDRFVGWRCHSAEGRTDCGELLVEAMRVCLGYRMEKEIGAEATNNQSSEINGLRN